MDISASLILGRCFSSKQRWLSGYGTYSQLDVLVFLIRVAVPDEPGLTLPITLGSEAVRWNGNSSNGVTQGGKGRGQQMNAS